MPGRRIVLLRLWGIGRETLVVVSVGGLMGAVALLPRVVGEPKGQHFVLSPIPAAKSTSVTAPTFALPPPHRAHVRQRIALGLAAAPASLAPAPIARPQKRVVRAGHPTGTSLRDAPPQTQPEPVAPAKSPPASTPITPAAPPSPAPQPAEIPGPTPAPPQPAITVTPAAPAALAVGLTIQSTAAVQSATNDSSKNPERGHPHHGKKHAEESSAAPIVALTPSVVAVSDASQVTPSPVADGAPPSPPQETPHEPNRGHGHKGAGDAIPIAPVVSLPQQPEPTTVYDDTASASGSDASPPSSAPDPSSAGPSSPSAPLNTGSNGHGHDDGVAGPQGHTKGR